VICEWDAAGRWFAAVAFGQTWHWIDPAAGAAKAVEDLRPGGRLAVFWNAGQITPQWRPNAVIAYLAP
jgi:hypothetical protein